MRSDEPGAIGDITLRTVGVALVFGLVGGVLYLIIRFIRWAWDTPMV